MNKPIPKYKFIACVFDEDCKQFRKELYVTTGHDLISFHSKTDKSTGLKTYTLYLVEEDAIAIKLASSKVDISKISNKPFYNVT